MVNDIIFGDILYSGSLPRKFLGGLKSINLACISRETFLHKVIQSMWILQRNLQFTDIQGTDVVKGGDGRCDSIDHSAKYGSYTATNLETNKILNMETVQSNQVKSSNHMELKGFQETLTILDQFKIKIKSLVTDRIAKWLRDHRPDIEHFFYCWHTAKSIRKKIQSLAKRNACQLMGSWMKSLVNHFYWLGMSTQIDNKDLVEAQPHTISMMTMVTCSQFVSNQSCQSWMNEQPNG